MRKGVLAIAALALAFTAGLGLAGFGSASGSVLSADAARVDTGTTTTSTDTTTSTTTQPTPSPKPPPKRSLIAPGVTVGNVLVGWLTPAQATKLVRKTFERPLPLVISPTRSIRLAPASVGADANIEKAIRRAVSARAGAAVPLDVDVSRDQIRRYLLGLKLDRKPIDAGVLLHGLRPVVVEAAPGRHLKLLKTSFLIRLALKTHSRDPVAVPFVVLKPKILKVKVKRTAIVIMRGSNRLLFYLDQKLNHTFPVATGQARYPTPIGDFDIVIKERNPWWYPPDSDWAKGEDPIPPGPGNPLGTRWMGLSAENVGIHGTPDAASIGYSASHGCIRMRIPDAEWLFNHVRVGTPVFIVAS